MRTQTIVKYLRKLEELLAPKKAWCQGAMAKDKNGAGVDVSSKKAVCFCLLGGVERIGKGHDDPIVYAMAETLRADRNPYTSRGRIMDYNDYHQKRDVMGLIRRTIKRLEKSLA